MILVTAASGNVGSAVVKLLRDRQTPFRIGTRSFDSIDRDSAAVRLDFLDASTFRSAVQGCKAVFLLRPPAISDTRKTLNPFLDVARAEGVEQVVFVSVAGAADHRIVPHHAVEQHLLQGELGWTILRAGFFAQNLGDAYRLDIVERDRLFVPAGAGRVAFIDVRDIAEVAVQALIDLATHQQQIYTLTGGEAMTFAEVAQLLSIELGRSIAYQPVNIPAYALHLLRRQMPLEQVLVQTALHVGLRFGQAETVDETLVKLLGHSPRRLQDYIHDYRNLWLKTQA